MYVRFVTPLIHPDSGMETGFFRAAWYLWRTGCPDWIHEELDAQFDWFGDCLPIPGRMGRTFKRRQGFKGICWFRPQAREAIERARYCAWLIGEGGIPVEAVKISHAREVIWRDDHQIVIKPSQHLPRAFGGKAFVTRPRQL